MCELRGDGGQQRNERRAADRLGVLQQWCAEEFFFFFNLMLHLALATSRVFKASFASSCVFAQGREKERKKEKEKVRVCSSILEYITPPFGLALPSSSVFGSVG